MGLPAVNLLYTDAGVLLGQVYGELPFMILPLFVSLERLDDALLDAAADLGASPAAVFRRVVLPLSAPGALAGSLLVFVPSLGAYLAPDLLGGARTAYVGNLIQSQFAVARDIPFGAALSFVLSVLVARVAAAPCGGRCGARDRAGRGLMRAVAVLVYLFLYAPLLVLVAFSFNSGRLASSWEGFTLGVVRAGPRGRAHAGVAAEQPGGGARHHRDRHRDRHRRRDGTAPRRARRAPDGTPSSPCPSSCRRSSSARRWCCCSRPSACAWGWPPWSSPTSGSRSRTRRSWCGRAPPPWIPRLEEAAMDLGASPLRAFFAVTLPALAPGILAAALLVFALSIDDYVVTSFVAGVGATTLPVHIYSMVKSGVSPAINAVSTLLLLSTSLLLFAAWALEQGARMRAALAPAVLGVAILAAPFAARGTARRPPRIAC